MTEDTKVPFFEVRDGVKVIVRPMTGDEARVIFPYRPLSKTVESNFGGDQDYDDICMLINRIAMRCKMCQAPTKKEHLENGTCPDCDGRSERSGTDPHKRS